MWIVDYRDYQEPKFRLNKSIFFFLMYMYCIFTNVVLDMPDTIFKNYIEENPENLVSFSAPISKLENDTVNKHLGHHLIT